MSKTSRLDTIFFDEPPYYKEDVLINLEEMNLSASQGVKELSKNFQNISKTLEHQSNKMVSSLENEAEKSRIQSTIENEKLANGISETNYRLLDVANGIEGLGDVIRDGNENIIEAVGRSRDQIVDGLSKIDNSLNSLDFQVRMVNNSLGIISNQLGKLLEKISKPNETEALELADQARINLSLKKKEIALKVTRNALELSNGTSITVLAYHILTLSLFDDEASEKEIVETYEDYVNLVGFKLPDRQSDTEVVIQEINNTLYPVMATIGDKANGSVMLLTQTLYTSLYENRSKIDSILRKPLSSSTTLEMITHPNLLREYHWSILLKEYVIKKQSLNVYTAYIVALAKSHVLIKNELMILVIKHFYEEGFLYGAVVDSLAGNSDDTLNDALGVILSVLPQDIIGIDQKTYWAMKLYANKHSIKVDASLEAEFTEASEYVKTDIEESYISLFDNLQQEMYAKESEIIPQIEATQKEQREVSKKKREEWEKHNKAIDDKGYDEKINDARSQLSKLRPKLGSNSITTVFTVLGGLISVGSAISSFMGGEILAGLVLITLGVVTSVAIGYAIGIVINFIVNFIRESSSSSLENSIPNYKNEIAKKYNINVKKLDLDTQYHKKISDFSNQLESFKQKKTDILTSKLNTIIWKNLPKTEQLLKSDDEIRECTKIKLIGIYIGNRWPSDLKYRSSIKKINDVKKFEDKKISVNNNSYTRYKDKKGIIYIMTDEGIMRENKKFVSYNYDDSMRLIKKGEYVPL